MKEYYKEILDNIVNDFYNSIRSFGLDKKLRKPTIIVTDILNKENTYGSYRYFFGFNIIEIDKSLLKNYNEFEDKYKLYHVLFHELTHYTRFENNKDYRLKSFIINTLTISSIIPVFYLPLFYNYYLLLWIIPYIPIYKKVFDKVNKYKKLEEFTTEALTIIFLSKVFKKEEIEKMNDIISYGSKEYFIGSLLGNILLNIDKEKQREIVHKLIKANSLDNIKYIIYELTDYLPENEYIKSLYKEVLNYINSI
ncbi:hypothetical protein YN1_8230 [Nanoarchaeota archaeon]